MSTSNSAPSRTFRPAIGFDALFDFAVSSHRRAISVLAVIAMIAFVPGIFSIPPIDRDETGFAQATKQMIETGDYVDIRLEDEVHYTKPIGIHWLQAAVVRAAEAAEFTDAPSTIVLYRLPSIAGALAAVLATYWCALAFVNRRGAVLAAVMVGSSTVLGVEARLAIIDAALLPTIIIAMAVLARVYLSPHNGPAAPPGWTLPAIFWTAIAAGVLLKGPVIVMVVVLAAAAVSLVDRSARWLLALRPLAGIAWVIVLVLPWFLAIYARAGEAFFATSVLHDALGKISQSQEGHGAPPGFYLLFFFVTFFPGATLAGLALPAVWAGRRERGTRFLLAWLVPSWLVFELSATKLPHYVMPLYPAIAILIAEAIEADMLSRARWLQPGLIWWWLFPLFASAGFLGLAMFLSGNVVPMAWPFLAGAMVCGLFAWLRYETNGAALALIRAAAAAILLAIGVYGFIVPALTPLFPSNTIAEIVRRAECTHPLVASDGYGEQSLFFLVGTATRLVDTAAAADFLGQGRCRFAVIDVRREAAFAQRAQAEGIRYDRKGDVGGFNFVNGKPVALAIFQSADSNPRAGSR
jgi:4-amino-4-deoxy-L-arabinose transferase-like glycosyltransferase